jgi:CubicO group peptidase (beta-lactamase class C family)
MEIDFTSPPPPEAEGGWPWLDRDGARDVAGMDPDRLDVIERWHETLFGGESTSVAIVRRGRLVREFHSFNVGQTMRHDLWSGTKSFTATAWLLALARLASGADTPALDIAPTLDTPAYDLLGGVELSDPRKARITVRHLLSMTSGIAGESTGIAGMPTATGAGIFEFALGHAANRFGQRVETLVAEPGERWDYSDPAYAHLSLCFHSLMGTDIDAYMQERVFGPLGMAASWDVQGGAGFRGPHTNAHTGLHVSARDVARFGQLVLNQGRWGGEQVLPAEILPRLHSVSQDLNPAYGLGWWTNQRGAYAPDLPADLVALSGFRFNRCYVVPSLDLVVARLGTGPVVPDGHALIRSVIESIL